MRADSRDLRSRLWDIAAEQRGYFTAAQALRIGYSYQGQWFHTQRGDWVRVDRGLFRFQEFDALSDGEHDHLVRWSLWSQGQGVVSHVSALAVHDLGIANPAKIHLTVPQGFRRRHPAVVLHFGQPVPEEIQAREGFLVSSPVRAVVESAAEGVDQELIDSAVTDLLERGMTTKRQLLMAAQHHGSRAELGIDRALTGEPHDEPLPQRGGAASRH
ncbi:type IV toxin-antitoxin system AbiEi family antitoxin domain-containing protein [Rhizohabitans arisaemae]|uniref:type IV toxin-antitoxin system AbiEi family antitoxin domain-containing protein n=1 Tax=Rhizohabitans arisaemae TaxID=2720610 RepID=UPI0024B06356|nr:hypothetical protein [Rhizohabitans arisaemae]